VILRVKRRRSGLHVMQFGLDIEDDFRGGNAYDLAARYQILALDRRGAEWRNDLFIGNRAGVASGFYQPLDRRLRYFVVPRLYLGYGLAEGGRDRVFLVIGRPRR